MNVLHVNMRATEGGAAVACHRLHTALRAAGHESRIVSTQPPGDRADLHTWVPDTRLWRAVKRATAWVETRLGADGLLDLASAVGCPPLARWADVVHLHNLHGHFFSLWLLPAIERQAPIVWTPHDMWPLTGGCTLALDCDRWRVGCGNCPAPRAGTWVDTSGPVFRLLRRIYARVQPVVAAPARWLADNFARSPLTAHWRTTTIPNGIDTRAFRPEDRRRARAALGLAERERVLLTCATDLRNPVKGADLLLAALERLRAKEVRNVRLVTIGRGGFELTRDVPYATLDLGTLRGPDALRRAYSAADLLVLPSRMETLPNVVVEAMACGTPCAAFAVGGVRELVRPGETGWLAHPGIAASLAAAIRAGLEAPGEVYARMRAECRRVAEARYDVDLMRRRYASLYRDVVAAHHSR